MQHAKPKAIVIGAGPVGCLASQLLASRGYDVDVFEKRPPLQFQTAAEEGRTIGLSLSPRGMNALDRLACGDVVRAISTPMDRRILHPVSGDAVRALYGPGCWNHAVSRNELNWVLFNRASSTPSIRFHFDSVCQDIAPAKRAVQLLSRTGDSRWFHYDLLLAADGAHSLIREQLARQAILQTEKVELAATYKELTVSASSPLGALSRSAIHIWPREGYFLVALPRRDGAFTGTLVLNESAAQHLQSFRTPRQAAEFLGSQFSGAFANLPTLESELATHRLNRLITASSSRLCVEDSIALLGDAAHAIAPFLGQGINLGFEDCQVLANAMAQNSGQSHSLRQYADDRKINGDAAAELSLANYRELSASLDTTDAPNRATARPGHGMPVVTAVNFMNLSYREVLDLFSSQPAQSTERNETIHA